MYLLFSFSVQHFIIGLRKQFYKINCDYYSAHKHTCTLLYMHQSV